MENSLPSVLAQDTSVLTLWDNAVGNQAIFLLPPFKKKFMYSLEVSGW